MIKWLPVSLIVCLVLACNRGGDEHSDVAASSTPAVSTVENPTVAPRPEKLPTRMEKALNAYAPHFVRFGAGEYAANMDTTTRVESDFNGDNQPDVALYGHDLDRELLLVLLSQSDTSYRVFPIRESRLEPFPSGVTLSLGVHPAGPLALPELLREANTPASLKYPGLEVTFGREATAIYYWDGARFIKIVAGD